ncbi:MAG: hypothetical protein C5B52_13425 [Bacteroidetes bacterium]|nr:MAG: hypothetical protein C5B52_13425 [Bacteroidota bacterium]
MSYELIGKLIAKYDTVQRTQTFKTREFVVEKSEDIGGRVVTNYVKFQCVQDKTSMIDRYAIGETVKVHFNIKGTRWEKNGQVNYITNLDAWRMETLNLGQGASVPEHVNTNLSAPADIDDLPF